jgi:GH24 family phage-related lysozyme (muramidase)
MQQYTPPPEKSMEERIPATWVPIEWEPDNPGERVHVDGKQMVRSNTPMPSFLNPLEHLSFQREDFSPPPAAEAAPQGAEKAPQPKAEVSGGVSPSQEASQGVSEEEFKSFALVEGYRSKAYEDSQGNVTVGIGFNMDQPGAEDVWKRAGIGKDFQSVKEGQPLTEEEVRGLLDVTLQDARSRAKERATELGVDWDGLPSWHRAILTDLAFNVGYLTEWTKVFRATSPREVLLEARRREGGKHTKGMDNRVARIGLKLGLISSDAEARELGLKLARLTGDEVRGIRGSSPEPTHFPGDVAQADYENIPT